MEEKELVEIVEETVVDELENVSGKPNAMVIGGIAVVATGALLFAFRKKIKAGIEKLKAKRLSKKNNTTDPEQSREDIEKQIFDPVE